MLAFWILIYSSAMPVSISISTQAPSSRHRAKADAAGHRTSAWRDDRTCKRTRGSSSANRTDASRCPSDGNRGTVDRSRAAGVRLCRNRPAPGLGRLARDGAGHDRQALLVTQLNVPAIRQTKRLIDILKDEGLYSLPVSIVLNRYVKRFNEHARIRQCNKALDHTIDHYLPEDERTALEAINRGVPLTHVRRRARLCRAIREIAIDCGRELAARDPMPIHFM